MVAGSGQRARGIGRRIRVHSGFGVTPGMSSVRAGQLIQQDGVAGLWRGVGPRMISAMLWGTCMVSAYEFLKRTCAVPLDDE